MWRSGGVEEGLRPSLESFQLGFGLSSSRSHQQSVAAKQFAPEVSRK